MSEATDQIGQDAASESKFKIKIPELEEFAKKATSIEDLAISVAEWLDMGKRKHYFTEFLVASLEVEEVSGKAIDAHICKKGITYKQSDKNWASNQVSNKLRKYSLTLMPFVNVLRQYKEHFLKLSEVSANADELPQTEPEETVSDEVQFSQTQPEEPVSDEVQFSQTQPEEPVSDEVQFSQTKLEEPVSDEVSLSQTVVEETSSSVLEHVKESNEGITAKTRVKMECLPEFRDFEKLLAGVDKTQPVEEKIRYVLNGMGLGNLSPSDQEQVVKIASIAVQKEKIADLEAIMLEAEIPRDKLKMEQMTFSNFINKFASSHGGENFIKVIEFLSDLRKVIMYEGKIVKE